MSLSIFKHKAITSIYVTGMLMMFLLAIVFTMLVIYEKYNDFDNDAIVIRKQFLKEQKNTIYFDVSRVIDFISHEYNKRYKSMDEKLLQEQIINAIEHLYERPDSTGYIFIYTLDGKNISDPIQKENRGKNLYHYKDENGVRVIKEFIDVSQQEQGGFVEYAWIKPTTGKQSSKISYAKSFTPWGWMVGTGVYFDEVEKLIASKKMDLKKRLIQYMMEILSLSVIIFGIGLAGVGIISYIINKEINIFTDFFQKASKTYIAINEEEVQLHEFKKMVKYTNAMVSEIHKRKKRLTELNASLEKNVEKKTEDLTRQNKLLEEEKSFSESLAKIQDSFIKHSIHEINTPLAVIMTNIDMHKIKLGEDKYLSQIEAASKMIANIYDDLSYMVKKDRFVYEKEWIEFSLFLFGRIEFFREIALGNRHKIILDIQDGIQYYFSTIELQRIVDNNLSNAIKYAKRSSDIFVTLTKSDDKIFLSFKTHSYKIKDTKRIFEPFHRENDIKGGFGLGLEIVHSICHKENIAVEVNSSDDMTIFKYIFSTRRGDESFIA